MENVLVDVGELSEFSRRGETGEQGQGKKEGREDADLNWQMGGNELDER
jgi:hypothetical protein